jgi:hypothetical protein
MCIFAWQKLRMKRGGERNIIKGQIRRKKNEIYIKKAYGGRRKGRRQK